MIEENLIDTILKEDGNVFVEFRNACGIMGIAPGHREGESHMFQWVNDSPVTLKITRIEIVTPILRMPVCKESLPTIVPSGSSLAFGLRID